MPTATNREHLTRLSALVDANAAEASRLVADLDAARLLWRPTPERWSVADCLEHLVTTGAVYHPRLRAVLATATHDAALEEAPWSPTWFGRLVMRAVAPEGRAVRARGPFIPPPGRIDSCARLLAQQDELRTIIIDAHGADLRALRVESPLSKLLPLRLGEALEMLLVHQQRHFAQAWRVRRSAGFPASRAAG
ncbi:MAG: DinB family protein [Gemmatirosa sp.]